ncbi:MAG: hypothetical protein IPO32_00910 [Crocinitomicaceae bacterium]|nr:hypothetical protein [Crocinitomicaceae bacterium]
MNLDYSVDQLRELVGADLKGAQHLPADFKVRNVVIDTRNPAISNQSLFVALSGSKEDGHKYLEIFAAKGGKIALVTREISSVDICQLVVKDALVALQTIAENHRSKFKIPVIAITGSNGKTIVKEWLYQTLKDSFSVVRSPKSYNSQIGVALSLLEMLPNIHLEFLKPESPNQMRWRSWKK